MDRSFDIWDRVPENMKAYLSNYGFNFSKKMCQWAVSMMKTKEGNITPITKEKLDELLKRYNVTLEKDNGYNAVYAVNMARADYMGSSIQNEQMLALFVKDYIDDPDYPSTEKAFRHFFADMMGMGRVINWADMLD
jgi:hypothetical protein